MMQNLLPFVFVHFERLLRLDRTNVWNRLEAGIHTAGDMQLLRHEFFEAKFEGIFRTDYATAHNAANRADRLSGIE